MATFSRLQKIALVGLGALGGTLAYYNLNSAQDEKKIRVNNSWTTNFTPSKEWDKNWDLRDPKCLVKPLSNKSNPEEQNRYNEQLEKNQATATRHIFLIRHGQYNLDGATDQERVLTELGKRQAQMTGQRLKELDIKWTSVVRSTMTRAQETAKIIQQYLPDNLPVRDCQLIEEGAPIPPEPPVGHWKPEVTFFQDGARIEAGFRRYFHRAPPTQADDSYMLMVCHANVIRFFVCKALQFPPEGWLRMSLNHGSITWLSILPTGNVVLRCLGDTGYMDPASITSRGGGKKKPKKEKKEEKDIESDD